MTRERFVRKTKESARQLLRQLRHEGREHVRINKEDDYWVVSCERGYVPPKTIERRDTRAWDRDELDLLKYLDDD